MADDAGCFTKYERCCVDADGDIVKNLDCAAELTSCLKDIVVGASPATATVVLPTTRPKRYTVTLSNAQQQLFHQAAREIVALPPGTAGNRKRAEIRERLRRLVAQISPPR
jgi:hypothetical protein